MTNRIPALIISATHSGAGKTTVTRALLYALKKQGLNVQAFKIGADFIDPMYHRAILGKPSVNLDFWMMGEESIKEVYQRWSADADVAVIEGMGALFDGANGTDAGSAAHIARILDIPVVVVLDVYGMTRTTLAIMQGMDSFDSALQVFGYILNRCGSYASNYHREIIRAAAGAKGWEKVLAVISSEPTLEIPERHLGLLTTFENESAKDNSGLERVERQIDTNRIFKFKIPSNLTPAQGEKTIPTKARLAVAQDAAFCFYYEENLLALKRAGFEIVPFSPLLDESLPEDIDAIYFGGGYPESFGLPLAKNRPLAEEIRKLAESGAPIYAECGGLIYLGRSLTDFDGITYDMSGVLPIDFIMDSSFLAINYLEVKTTSSSVFGAAGMVLRGQEFHQSRIVESDIEANLYRGTSSTGEECSGGYQYKNVTASYAHIYFAKAETIRSWLTSAIEFREKLNQEL